MKPLFTLNRYFWKYRLRLALGIVFIFGSNLFGVLAPEIIGQAMDMVKRILEVATQGGTASDITVPSYIVQLDELFSLSLLDSMSNEQDVTLLAFKLAGALAIIYLLAALMKGVFTFMMRQTVIMMSRYIEYDVKNAIFEQYQKLDRGFFKRSATGDLMNRISEDVTAVRMYLGPAVMYTINTLALFILVISFMLREDVELTIYALTPLPIMTVLVYLVSDVINKKSRLKQEQQSKLSSIAQETFSGIRVYKSYGRIGSALKKFGVASDEFQSRSLSLALTNSLFMPAIILLIGVSTILTIYVGGMKVINGEDGITVGDIAKFVIYVNMLTWPFASVGWVTSLVQQASASMVRINEFLKQTPEIIDPEQGQRLDELREIVFENVSFTYPDTGIEALKNVSFTIPNGAVMAIVGHTGSGKSTVTELLTRQYDPTEGRVLVNGLDLRSLDLEAYHRLIGYVPQDVFLFSETIERNIAFSLDSDDSDMTKIVNAAKDADVHDDIESFKDGYQTVLGERGVTLSGGQKQRLSIARALIREPELLIFDDPLSAVDNHTEETILKALERIMKGRTSVMISHRITAIQKADNILVLDGGMIVESGTHDQLVSLSGHYAKLNEQQLLNSNGEG